MGTVPQIGQSTYYASQTGAILDCVISTGLTAAGGTPTDNTTVLQNFINGLKPSASNPIKIILDGCTMTSGLTIPGWVTIEGLGWGSGLYLKNGSNGTPLTIGSPTSTCSHVTLKNFQINGNQANQSNTSALNMYFGNVTHLRLESIFSLNPSYFNTFFLGCVDVVIDGCRFESTATTVKNTDGIHLGAGCKFVRIDNCYFRTNDDAIAVNAPEYWNGSAAAPISNVTVTNCVFDGCLSANRCYGWASSSDNTTVNGIMFSNCVGTLQPLFTYENSVHIFGINTNGSKPIDTVKDFTGIGFTFGGTTSPPIVFGDPCGAMIFKAYKWIAPTAAIPMFSFWASNSQISSLLIEGCSIYRNTAGNSAAFMLNAGAISGSVIKKLTIRGFGIDDEQGQSYSAIPYLIDMLDLTITELVIDALDSTLITALVNPTTGFTGIGSISGAGVLATGFQIPDSVMANNTPYISATGANAGLPCIKVGGTVYPYVLA